MPKKVVKEVLSDFEKRSALVNSLLTKSHLSRTPTGRLPALSVANVAVERQVLEHLQKEEEARRKKRREEAEASWEAWKREKAELKRSQPRDARPSTAEQKQAKKSREQDGYEAWQRWRTEKAAQARRKKAKKRREAQEKLDAELKAKQDHDVQVKQLFRTMSKRPTKRGQIIGAVPQGQKLAKLHTLSRNPLTTKLSKTEGGWKPHDAAARKAYSTGTLTDEAYPLNPSRIPAKTRKRRRKRKAKKNASPEAWVDEVVDDTRAPSQSSPNQGSPNRRQPNRLLPLATGSPAARSPFAVPLKVGPKPIPADIADAQLDKKKKKVTRRDSIEDKPQWNFDTKPINVIEEIRMREAMRAVKKRRDTADQAGGGGKPSMYDINGRLIGKPRRSKSAGRRRGSSTSRSSDRPELRTPLSRTVGADPSGNALFVSPLSSDADAFTDSERPGTAPSPNIVDKHFAFDTEPHEADSAAATATGCLGLLINSVAGVDAETVQFAAWLQVADASGQRQHLGIPSDSTRSDASGSRDLRLIAGHLSELCDVLTLRLLESCVKEGVDARTQLWVEAWSVGTFLGQASVELADKLSGNPIELSMQLHVPGKTDVAGSLSTVIVFVEGAGDRSEVDAVTKLEGCRDTTAQEQAAEAAAEVAMQEAERKQAEEEAAAAQAAADAEKQQAEAEAAAVEAAKQKAEAEAAQQRAQLAADKEARETAQREQAEAEEAAKEAAKQQAEADEAARIAQMAEADAEAATKAAAVARAQAELAAKHEAERTANEEAERAAKEKAERAAKEDAERAAKEDAERAAKEEAERAAKEKAERAAKEDAERAAKEKAERQAKEDAERAAKEDAEQAAKEAEQAANEEAEQAAKEGEAERAAKGQETQEPPMQDADKREVVSPGQPQTTVQQHAGASPGTSNLAQSTVAPEAASAGKPSGGNPGDDSVPASADTSVMDRDQGGADEQKSESKATDESTAVASPPRAGDASVDPDKVSVREAVESITREELSNLIAHRKPAKSVVSVVGPLCVLLSEKPTWRVARHVLHNPNFVDRLLDRKQEDVADRAIAIVRKLVAANNVVEHGRESGNRVTYILAKWIQQFIDDAPSA